MSISSQSKVNSEVVKNLFSQLKAVLPVSGHVFFEDESLCPVLCKPKILPLKSITLQKIEEMERKANEKCHDLKKDPKIESLLQSSEKEFRKYSKK